MAAIGPDGGPLLEILDTAEIDRTGVALLPGETYRWRAEHHITDAAPVAEEQQLGVYRDWRPRLTEVARQSGILFLGSMHPNRQMEILTQCSGAQLVALDTMRDFVRSNPNELDQLLHHADVFFATEAELRALLPESGADAIATAQQAVVYWSLRTVVLKRGARGAVVVSGDSVRKFPATPGPPVVDPTGAGDAFAGGMLGRLAQLRRSDDQAVERAMADGAAAARTAISAFGAAALLRSSR